MEPYLWELEKGKGERKKFSPRSKFGALVLKIVNPSGGRGPLYHTRVLFSVGVGGFGPRTSSTDLATAVVKDPQVCLCWMEMGLVVAWCN